MRSEKEYFSDIPSPKIGRDTVTLAEHILDSKESHFDPATFNDRYEAALKALVKRKASGRKIEAAEPAEKPGNVVNLMDALRQSLQAGKAITSSKLPTRHAARPRPKRRQRKAA